MTHCDSFSWFFLVLTDLASADLQPRKKSNIQLTNVYDMFNVCVKCHHYGRCHKKESILNRFNGRNINPIYPIFDFQNCFVNRFKYKIHTHKHIMNSQFICKIKKRLCDNFLLLNSILGTFMGIDWVFWWVWNSLNFIDRAHCDTVADIIVALLRADCRCVEVSVYQHNSPEFRQSIDQYWVEAIQRQLWHEQKNHALNLPIWHQSGESISLKQKTKIFSCKVFACHCYENCLNI